MHVGPANQPDGASPRVGPPVGTGQIADGQVLANLGSPLPSEPTERRSWAPATTASPRADVPFAL